MGASVSSWTRGPLLVALVAAATGCSLNDLPVGQQTFACVDDAACGSGFRCVSGLCRDRATCEATERCGDQLDNDCNGETDCADPSCAAECRDGGAGGTAGSGGGGGGGGTGGAGGDSGVDAGTDAGSTDGGSDGGAADAGADAGANDAGRPDAGGTDAGGTDAGGTDAGVDAGVDAGIDAGVDAGIDAGVDAGPPPTCTDGLPNGMESDVDCGGSCPNRCGLMSRCNSHPDCASGYCNAAFQCATPSCTDMARNGQETGTDCGLAACGNTCPAGEGCSSSQDCTSGVCTGQICRAPTCTDGVQNQGELQVDCGGPCPVRDAGHCGTTLILAHFDGPDGGSAFVDLGGHRVEPQGPGPQFLSSEQSRFGGSSLYLGGASAIIRNFADAGPDARLNLNGQPFTFEAWALGSGTLVSNDTFGFLIRVETGTLYFLFNGILPWSGIGTNVGSITPGWHHHAISYDGSRVSYFVDGALRITRPGTFSMSGRNITLGTYNAGQHPYWDGYVDEVRLLRGHAMYSPGTFLDAGFTPPNAPFVP